jgi:hypothetical protein
MNTDSTPQGTQGFSITCFAIVCDIVSHSIWYSASLVANHGLMDGTIPVSMWLASINDATHVLRFFLGYFNISRLPVFFKAAWLRGSRDRDQSLANNPGNCDLADLAPLASRELLDFLDNFLVLVEILALELGSYLED